MYVAFVVVVVAVVAVVVTFALRQCVVCILRVPFRLESNIFRSGSSTAVLRSLSSATLNRHISSFFAEAVSRNRRT